MYNEYWGFKHCPFSGSLDPERFYESPNHEEALARLSYVVDEGRGGGLLIGPPGVGKSLVVEVFARRVRRPNREVAIVRCPGFDARELFFELAQEFRLGPEPRATEPELWRSLRDHVVANRMEEAQTVIIVDQAHLLAQDSRQLRALHLLYHLDPHPASRLTVVLVARPELMREAKSEVIEWVDLGVALEPLSEPQTGMYVNHLTKWAGREEPLFDRDALRKVHELSMGVPRQINRVCDLALLAACSEEREEVTGEVVESVFRELIPAGSLEPAAVA